MSVYEHGDSALLMETVPHTACDGPDVRCRGRLQRQRDREARQLPFLLRRVEELRERCEGLTHELALTRQQKAAFQQEALTLRSLVKLHDHPEVAAVAAAGEATSAILRGEVRQLRRQVQELEEHNRRCLLQSEKACEAAEFYQRCLEQQQQQQREGKCGASSLPTFPAAHSAVAPDELCTVSQQSGLVAAPALPHDGDRCCAGAEEDRWDVCALQAALEGERQRARALGEALAFLQEDLAAARVKTGASCDASSPLVATMRVPADADDEGSAALRVNVDAFTPSLPPHHRCDTSAAAATDVARLRRFTEVLRCQNRMLTRRVSELAQRSVDYAAEVAALKLSSRQQHKASFSTSVAAMGEEEGDGD